MSIRTSLLIPLLIIAAACGGAQSSSTPTTPDDAEASTEAVQLPSDSDIVALIYDNLYSVPDGFFVDERAGMDRSYTVHHVLDDSNSYELCTDDYALAMAWEDADNTSRSVQGYFVTSYENDRYFEFVRELAYENDIGNIQDVTSPGFGRVFKCSNTNRDGVDRTLLDGYAGKIAARPLDSDTIRVFSEYLWQFRFFPNSRKKVVATFASETGSELEHTLLLAFASNQGAGNCDLVEVVEWRFSADRETGEVHRHFDIVRSFEARLVDGTPVICG